MSDVPTHIGRYEIVRRLGRGGMGTLLLARDPVLEREIAIKLLRGDDEELRQRFSFEARAAAKLDHRNIVTIFDIGEHNGQPFMAMEYVHGHTLAEIVKQASPLPVPKSLRLIGQLCDGLGYAHRRGIIHRDIKPANLMVTNDEVLKILDFGIARLIESARVTQVGTIIGTPNYMSPEQVTEQPIDRRSDQFAVGAVLYELLSRRQAFPGTLHTGILHRILHVEPAPILEIVPDLDPHVAGIIARALRKDPGERYDSLEEMRGDLSRALERIEAGTGAVASGRHSTSVDRLKERRAREIGAHLEHARAALAAGDLEGALASCEQALMFDTTDPSAVQLFEQVRRILDERDAMARAQAAFDQGRFDEALAAVGEALRLDPASADAAVLERRARTAATLARADAAVAAGRLDEASDLVEVVRNLEPNDPSVVAAHSRLDAAIRAAIDDALSEARRLVADGDEHGAEQRLARFRPARPERDVALTVLRAEIEDRRRRAAAAVADAMRLSDEGDPERALESLEAHHAPHWLVAGAIARLRPVATRARERREAVAVLLARARGFLDEGQHQLAFETCDQAAGLDPANDAVRTLRETIEAAVASARSANSDGLTVLRAERPPVEMSEATVAVRLDSTAETVAARVDNELPAAGRQVEAPPVVGPVQSPVEQHSTGPRTAEAPSPVGEPPVPLPTPPGPPRPEPKPGPFVDESAKRRRMLLGYASAAVLVLVLLGGGGYLLFLRPSPPAAVDGAGALAEAGRLYDAGDRVVALQALDGVLARQPDETRASDLRGRWLDAARAELAAARDAASRQGATAANSPEFADGATAEQTAADLAGEGRDSDALRWMWDATGRFASARPSNVPPTDDPPSAPSAPSALTAKLDEAESRYGRGQRTAALSSVTEVLAEAPDNQRARDLLGAWQQVASTAVDRARATAAANGSSADNSAEFKQAEAAATGASRAERAGRLPEALRFSWQAEALFSRARPPEWSPTLPTPNPVPPPPGPTEPDLSGVRSQYAAGNRTQALVALDRALASSPGSTGPTALRTEWLAQARQHVASARAAATAAGATSDNSSEFRQALARERDAGGGPPSDALRAAWEASARYEEAVAGVTAARAQVRAALEGFARAYESRDIDQLRAVWPSLSSAEQADSRRVFVSYRTISWEFESIGVALSREDRARVDSVVTKAMVPLRGSGQTQLRQTYTFDLERSATGWRIVGVSATLAR